MPILFGSVRQGCRDLIRIYACDPLRIQRSMSSTEAKTWMLQPFEPPVWTDTRIQLLRSARARDSTHMITSAGGAVREYFNAEDIPSRSEAVMVPRISEGFASS